MSIFYNKATEKNKSILIFASKLCKDSLATCKTLGINNTTMLKNAYDIINPVVNKKVNALSSKIAHEKKQGDCRKLRCKTKQSQTSFGADERNELLLLRNQAKTLIVQGR